jgi:aspartyl-tRNA(Asn)/glutamyl-tRNA(Gln) amidotransferase subunit B
VDSATIRIDPVELAALVRLVDDGTISRSNAKEVLAEHVASGGVVATIVAERGFTQISDADALGVTLGQVLEANPNAVADYKAGKVQAVGFLVGQVMKATKGQADASVVQRLVRERLDR